MLLTGLESDGPTPEKQTEQILAIYPILKGQKSSTVNAIPPRGSVSGPSSHHIATEKPPQDQPVAEKRDDLIDFGQNDSSPPAPSQRETQPEITPDAKPENRPAIDPSHKSTAEIQSMLSETGSRAPGGPLIDFHQDMKTSLPAGFKRADTAESSDEFVDAQE
jgi:hypothetical protein